MAFPNSSDPEATQASVIDIVSFGYRHAFKQLPMSTKMALPTIIIGGIIGFIQAYTLGLPKDDMRQLIGLPAAGLSLVNAFNIYAISIYIRDCYSGEAQDSVGHYWNQTRVFKKLFLLGLMLGLLIIPIILLGALGAVLLLIPGIMWFSYVFTTYNLIWAVLVDKPDLGIRGSIKETFRLLKDNTLRTIGLGLLSGIIAIVITLPLSFLKGIVGATAHLAPSQLSIGLFILSGGLSALVAWFSLAVGFCGTMFVMYRYITDLKTRHGDYMNAGYDNDPASLPPGIVFGLNHR